MATNKVDAMKWVAVIPGHLSGVVHANPLLRPKAR